MNITLGTMAFYVWCSHCHVHQQLQAQSHAYRPGPAQQHAWASGPPQQQRSSDAGNKRKFPSAFEPRERVRKPWAQFSAAPSSSEAQRYEEQQRLFRDARQNAYCRSHFVRVGTAAELARPVCVQPTSDVDTDKLVEQALQRARHPSHRLGLDEAASAAAVRKNYLALALRLHPDKCDHPRSHEAFAAVQAAHKELTAT
jgi:hypothetical protein